MLRYGKSTLAALCATTILAGGSAWAADATPAPLVQEAAVTSSQSMADKDLRTVSADGAAGFENISLTRRAIFEGRTDDAKKFVALAEAGFDKAKGDHTAYDKAESALALSDGKGDKGKAATAATTPPPDEGAPIAWVPVDASISIAEDVAGNAAKTAAVGDANKSLQTGDRNAAVHKLKVAGIEVAVVLAVVPLEKTIDKVHKAVGLIDEGKYYEGSQQLRLAQADERFDVVGNLGTPKE